MPQLIDRRSGGNLTYVGNRTRVQYKRRAGIPAGFKNLHTRLPYLNGCVTFIFSGRESLNVSGFFFFLLTGLVRKKKYINGKIIWYVHNI